MYFDQVCNAAWVAAQRQSLSDSILVPLVVLSSMYVYNKGSLWPISDPLDYMWYEVPQASMGLVSTRAAQSRNLALRITESQAKVVIFWGSQSGTAEGFAHRLARELHQKYDLTALVVDMSDFDAATLELIPRSVPTVFVISTYGEGEPSDNAQDFFSWAEASRVSLDGLKYAGFGCGNSNYRYYNKTIDDLTFFLCKAGAQAMIPTGKGNEATRTTEEDFMDWKDALLSFFESELSLKEVDRPYEPEVNVENLENHPVKLHLGEPFQGKNKKQSGSKNSDTVLLPLVSNIVLAKYAEGDRSCIELTVDLSAHPQVKYKTGDHVAVWPENKEDEVSSLIQILGLEGKRKRAIGISPVSELTDVKVPSATTIEALFRNYLEICAPVSREAVISLARMAPSEKVKDALLNIGKDKATYTKFLDTRHMTISRLLAYGTTQDHAVSWGDLPLSFIIDILHPMKPRLYSISTSRITSPRHVGLTVSIKPTTLLNPDATISGLTSVYLKDKEVTAGPTPSEPVICTRSTIWAQIRLSTFKLPTTSTMPIIMIAAGTGIAPFRAFIQERSRLKAVGRSIGKMVLFFGCQNENDYLYSNELSVLMDGSLREELRIVTAFSRAGNKTYVQDRIRSNGGTVGAMLLDDDAALYICGAATMAKEVNVSLSNIVKTARGWSDDQVEDWRLGRKRGKRWFEDVWS